MRFYRLVFWLLSLAHLGLGAWFCFAPETVKIALDHAASMPLIFTQSQGLYFWILSAGFAYTAENPQHGVPVVALLTLTKALMPLFALVGFTHNELSQSHLYFELALDLRCLPLLISYFFWYYDKPRPNRFVHLIGLFGKDK